MLARLPRSASVAGLLPLILLNTQLAYGAPKDAEANELAKKAIDTDYLGTKFDDAVKHLKEGLAVCGPKSACTDKVRAQLHMKLGAVLLGGLHKADEAKAEFKAAVAADTSVSLDPDLSSPEVEAAFAEAKKAGGAKVAPAAEPEAEAETKPEASGPAPAGEGETPGPDAAKGKGDNECPPDFPGCGNAEKASDACEPGAPGCDKPKVRKNWISLAVQQDTLFVPSNHNVCSGNSTAWLCEGAGNAPITVNNNTLGLPAQDHVGNEVAGGLGFATTRVLAGYDRSRSVRSPSERALDGHFDGHPATTGHPNFLPIHAEARLAYYFGDHPFSRVGIRPYALIGGGAAQVDASLNVTVFQGAAAYPNGATKVIAWDVAGQSFVTAGIGAMYAIKGQHGPFLEFKYMELVPQVSPGLNLQLGYAVGF